MTLFEALPVDITEALYHYCKDDECLNDAMLRALRNELKIDQVEHNKFSHDCLRCDKFEGELKNFKARAKELIRELLDLRSLVSSAKDVENRFAVREKAKRFLEEEE